MQGRLFSYTDTQLIRLGGPNFHEIPINRPVVPVHNNQRDGHMRQQINAAKISYSPNSLGDNFPMQAKMSEGGFSSYPEKINAPKLRERGGSFFDHFSQARLFFNSQSDPEKNHIIDALSFELGKVQTVAIRERMLGILSQIDKSLATGVAYNLGLHVPKKPEEPINHSIPADGDPKKFQPFKAQSSLDKSPALSMAGTIKDSIQTRKIAILASDGVDEPSLTAMKKALEVAGAVTHVIAPKLGMITAGNDAVIAADQSFLTAASVLYDAVYVAGGDMNAANLACEPDAVHFINEAYKHCKAIAAESSAIAVLEETYFSKKLQEKKIEDGILIGNGKKLVTGFIGAIAQHRFWEREKPRKVPA